MKLETAVQGDVTVLAVFGALNADSASRFNQAVAETLARQRRDFVVDLAGMTTIDSTGLEALTAVQRQCEEQLGMVRISGADATVRKVLEITRLDGLLTLSRSTQEALASFAPV